MPYSVYGCFCLSIFLFVPDLFLLLSSPLAVSSYRLDERAGVRVLFLWLEMGMDSVSYHCCNFNDITAGDHKKDGRGGFDFYVHVTIESEILLSIPTGSC